MPCLPLLCTALQRRGLRALGAHTIRRRQAKALEHQGSTHHDQRQVGNRLTKRQKRGPLEMENEV